jgi:hypothetical protein
MPSVRMPGFKDLTPANFLHVDDMLDGFVRMSENGEIVRIPHDEWARSVLSVDLIERTPIEVHRLFLVARGAMLYGFYFYPLFALASEQLFRVADTAALMKCDELGAPTEQSPRKRRGFSARINWLRGRAILSEDRALRWHALREMRNSASHPVDQTILFPSMALNLLYQIAEDVNYLFESGPSGQAEAEGGDECRKGEEGR